MKSICEHCENELNAYNRILIWNTGNPIDKVSFKKDRLEWMKTLCVDCAAKECQMWQVQRKGYGDQRTDYWRKECEKAVLRAENVNKYTIKRQLGES